MSIITIRNKKYEVIKKLGVGGFGSVSKVKRKSDNKLFALKEIIIKNEMKDKIKDIQKEAEILSQFDCRNIVKYYDSQKINNKFYILMEYCEGQNLRDYIDENIKNNTLIEENILYKIILQICIGIKEIHNKHIIHRDIKPENIFINKRMEIKLGKLGDFGISKQFNPIKEYATTLNKPESIEYMAPEILVKGIYNKKSDMYSLGCIIYELFNLRKYYDDNLMQEIKKLDPNLYDNKWQEIIDSLLKGNYNDRMDINEVYDILLNEINKNELENEDNAENDGAEIPLAKTLKELEDNENNIDASTIENGGKPDSSSNNSLINFNNVLKEKIPKEEIIEIKKNLQILKDNNHNNICEKCGQNNNYYFCENCSTNLCDICSKDCKEKHQYKLIKLQDEIKYYKKEIEKIIQEYFSEPKKKEINAERELKNDQLDDKNKIIDEPIKKLEQTNDIKLIKNIIDSNYNNYLYYKIIKKCYKIYEKGI